LQPCESHSALLQTSAVLFDASLPLGTLSWKFRSTVSYISSKPS
jgi:hypothetical protein